MRQIDIKIAKGLIPASALFVADPEGIFVELNSFPPRITEHGASQSAIADGKDGLFPNLVTVTDAPRDFAVED
jgi:hypothetical protein